MKKFNIKSPLSLSVKDMESLKGYVFLIPLIIGLILFFIIPVVKSFLFSVSDVTSGANGYVMKLKDFSAYYDAIKDHTTYRQTVVESVMSVLATTPLIIIFSFFMASVLNQNFKGKTFFRVVLFLPVILEVMNSQANTLENSMSVYSDYKSGGGEQASVSFTSQISEWMTSAGLSEEISSKIISLTDSVYGVIGLSAIQILILLIAMQSISPSLYEAATVEGATGWESFWKITFPMVSPMIMVCIIYTIIDSFTSSTNGVMALMNTTAFSDLKFSLASAMGWIYFAMIAALLGIVAFIFSKFVYKYDE